MKMTLTLLKGDDNHAAFNTEIAPVLCRIVKDAGYEGTDWEAIVYGIHRSGAVPRATLIRIGSIRDSKYQIEINVRPKHGGQCSNWTYDIRLCVPRSLHFVTVCNDVTAAIQKFARSNPTNTDATMISAIPYSSNGASPHKELGGGLNDAHGSRVPTPTAPKPAELLVAGIGRLEGMRTSLDAVINMARDARASAEILEELKARHDKAAEAARPLLRVADDAEALAIKHRKHLDSIDEDLASTRQRLARLSDEHAKALEDLKEAEAAHYRAVGAAEEPNAAWEAAAKELDAANKLEAERLKTINETPGVAGILAGLESMLNAK